MALTRDQVKVGDRVLVRRPTKQEPHWQKWAEPMDCVDGVVVTVEDFHLMLRDWFTCEDCAYWLHLAWCDLVDAPAHTAAPPPVPCHVESIKYGYNKAVPDRLLAEAIDRGECGIRRRMREWPYGKRLTHEQVDMGDRLDIRWHWANAEVE